jgi:hypothetical protein
LFDGLSYSLDGLDCLLDGLDCLLDGLSCSLGGLDCLLDGLSYSLDGIDFDNPPLSAKADAMFDCPEVLDYRSGNVMELESLPTFKQRWDNNGGLGGFQTCIQNLLGGDQIFV